MPHWDGNNYNRKKDLPKFLKKLNPEELQAYGRKKKDKSFMINYNYSSYDKDQMAIRNDTKITNTQYIPTHVTIQLTEETKPPTGSPQHQRKNNENKTN